MSGTTDILGHEAAISRLWGALSRDALHHAYLFEGPPGVGKRTVGLRLAMAANCTGDAAAPPCGTCPTCKQIAAGNHPDVVLLEPDLDRATPIIRVAQVREVVRKSGYHRYGARRRFIVVDPAEAMQDAAANALLKTLEEPPAGTGFILIATHASSLLPTIRSRCQRVRFSAIPDAALAAWLEERGVEDPVGVARMALGCPGLALALAEGQLSERRAIRDRLLVAIGGRLDDIDSWASGVCKGGRQRWRPEVEAILEITEELLRDAALVGAGAQAPPMHEDIAGMVSAWSGALWPDGVARCARAVDEARLDLARNVSGRLLLEALVTRLATELGKARRAGR